MKSDLSTAIAADRAYRDGFLQACREWTQHLSDGDNGAAAMNKRCAEMWERYRNDLAQARDL